MPSAFQAEFGPTPMCFSRSDQTRDRHSDVLDQSVWLVGPILARPPPHEMTQIGRN